MRQRPSADIRFFFSSSQLANPLENTALRLFHIFLIHFTVKVTEQTFEERAGTCDQMKRIGLSVVKNWTGQT